MLCNEETQGPNNLNAVTMFPYIPWVVKNPDILGPQAPYGSAPYNTIVDAHEAVHWGGLEGYKSEKLAYLQQLIVAQRFLENGYNGVALTETERKQVMDARTQAIDELKD